MSIYIFNFLTMYMIFAGMIQSQQQMDSDDEVRVIDPPVIIRSGCKKYHRKILKEEIDVRFCRHSKRINRDVDDSRERDNIDTIDVITQEEDSQDANSDFIGNSVEQDFPSR
jgi:hypothetical protein